MQGKTIILGVTGGIAAYKTCDLASQLTQRGARVKVVLTESAQQFVTPLTYQALTQQPVYTSLWPSSHDAQSGVESAMAHIALANEADAIMVAPMSADFGAKLAFGHSSDLLSTIILATRAPVLLAPAMNPAMWHHAATQRNLQVLAGFGYTILEPESGRMACEHGGVGRLPTTDALIGALEKILFPTRDMSGLQVLVTAGPTREALDPVRFLSNRSSGRMGFAIAEECARRGASVHLICGPTNLSTPPNVSRVDVTTTAQMHDAVQNLWPHSDVLIASAAPADFQAAQVQTQKIKKRDGQETLTLELTRTPDIIAHAAQSKKAGQIVVGFAAETENLLEHARKKLRDKNLDAIVANDVSASDAGFDVDTNRVTWMTPEQSENWPLLRKSEVAAKICDAVLKLGPKVSPMSE